MKLLRLELDGRYKLLNNCVFDFSQANSSCIALIGLNGCGKSQFLELLAECLSHLERCQRPDFRVRQKLTFGFTLEYELHPEPTPESNGIYLIKVTPSSAVTVELKQNGITTDLSIKDTPLPDHWIGYASGNNENLQRAFLKNALQYYETTNVRANRLKRLRTSPGELHIDIEEYYSNRYPGIFPHTDTYGQISDKETPIPNGLYLDYDSSTLLVASLSCLKKKQLDELFPDIEYRYPISFKVKYDLRDSFASPDAIDDLEQLSELVGESCTENPENTYTDEEMLLRTCSGAFNFDLNKEELSETLRGGDYWTPRTLFLKLFRIQLLGAKHWQSRDKKNLRNDAFDGNVKKPLKGKLPLEVTELKLCNGDGKCIDFDDLSDGEAQLMVSLGITKTFSDAQTLFLFDEPEAHLNPHWRTEFHQHLSNALGEGTATSHVLVSTHSPFMISSLKKGNVFHFTRDEEPIVSMSPAEYDTYGASFESLVRQYFDLDSLISKTVVDEILKRLEGDHAEARAWIESELSPSMEKAYLLSKLQN